MLSSTLIKQTKRKKACTKDRAVKKSGEIEGTSGGGAQEIPIWKKSLYILKKNTRGKKQRRSKAVRVKTASSSRRKDAGTPKLPIRWVI